MTVCHMVSSLFKVLFITSHTNLLLTFRQWLTSNGIHHTYLIDENVIDKHQHTDSTN